MAAALGRRTCHHLLVVVLLLLGSGGGWGTATRTPKRMASKVLGCSSALGLLEGAENHTHQ